MTDSLDCSTADAERRGNAVRLVAAHAQAEHVARQRPLTRGCLIDALRRRLPRALAVTVTVEEDGPFLRVLVAGTALACVERDGQLAWVTPGARVPRDAPAFGSPAFTAGRARYRGAVAVVAARRARALGSRGRCGARARASRPRSRARRTASSRAGPSDGSGGGSDDEGGLAAEGPREAVTAGRAGWRRPAASIEGERPARRRRRPA